MRSSMKRAVIRQLKYPAQLVETSLDRDRCPHGGIHQETGQCARCESDFECAWLNRIGDPGELRRMHYGQLVGELLVAQAIVRSRLQLDSHSPVRCLCPGCKWLRQSRRMSAF